MRHSAFTAFVVAAALVAGACAEMFQPIPPPELPTEPPALPEDPFAGSSGVLPLVPPATPRPTPTPTPAPPLRFVSFRATFEPTISTTLYEIRVEDPLGGELLHFWRLRFARGVCGHLDRTDLESFAPTREDPFPPPRFVPRNGYVHDGCNVDVVERGAKVEVQVVRGSDLLPSGALRPGAGYLLYLRSARAGDSAETRAWPLDEVVSQQTVP